MVWFYFSRTESQQFVHVRKRYGKEISGTGCSSKRVNGLENSAVCWNICSSQRGFSCIPAAFWWNGEVLFLSKPSILDLLNTLHLSFATISQLELLFNRKTQSTKGSVFEAINRTVTTGGRQMLRSWLQSPSAEEVGLEGRWEVGDD